jgi:hypothetical protein
MTHDHSALLTQLDALKGANPSSVFAETGLSPVELTGGGERFRPRERHC